MMMRSRQLLSLGLMALVAETGCGGSSSSASAPTAPTTSQVVNRVPVVTSVSVSPTFGVSGLTLITMQASATDADNDALTYTWSFGGATATGASTSAKVTGDGAVAVQVSVSDGRGGTTTDSRLVTIGTMTGSWDFVAGNCGANAGEKPAVFVLTQTGTTVNGLLTYPTRWCNVPANTHGEISAAAPGTIDALGNFELTRVPVGSFSDARLFGGKMSASGRVVTGTIYNSGFNGESFTLTKK